ncbi:ashwin isoform X2 [Camelus dromedarius]|uniref:ashwin isoform X2 n=1 Tax=Camelus dromedarius TaxID=9838 RepID=UPI0012635733|nr:ashwin isoform X2 [Camelus dromedarius]
MAGDVAGRGCADSELLLHPELLSQEFLLLTLEQKNIAVENDVRVNKDSLTDLYVQHAIPLPRRDLPKNRWGKMMEKKREQHETKNETKRSGTVDGLRKRALVMLEGSSTSASIKVRRTEDTDSGRPRPPPPARAPSSAFRKLSDSSASVSPLILSSNLPTNNKMEHNNNDTKQNHDLTHRKSPPGPVKSPPLSPVGTTPVKLKRAAAPREDAEAAPEAPRSKEEDTARYVAVSGSFQKCKYNCNCSFSHKFTYIDSIYRDLDYCGIFLRGLN